MSLGAEGSLFFYCGALGSGKTSFAFEEALEHLLRGGTVVTNISFYPDKIADWMHRKHGLKFDPSRLIKVEDGENVWKSAVRGDEKLATMLLIDEAHVEHNARSYQDTNKEQIMFNTMVRKLRVKVVYITQDMNNVDKQFRRMAQRIVYCRNLAQFRFLGFIKFPFNMFIRVPYVCGPGAQPQKQSPEMVFRPLSWGMFDSHSLVGRAQDTFGVLAAANTSPLEKIKRPPVPFNWAFYGSILAALFIALT